MKKQTKENMEDTCIEDIGRVILGFIFSLIFAGVIFWVFMWSGAIKIGTECPTCENGETFTSSDLFQTKHVMVGVVGSLLITIFLLNAFMMMFLSDYVNNKKSKNQKIK